MTDPEAERLQVIAAVGGPHPEALVGQIVDRDEALCAKVVATGQPLVVGGKGWRPPPARSWRSWARKPPRRRLLILPRA